MRCPEQAGPQTAEQGLSRAGGQGAVGSHCLMQNRVSFVGDKNVLELGGGDRVVTASQPCERSKEHRIMHFKKVDFM